MDFSMDFKFLCRLIFTGLGTGAICLAIFYGISQLAPKCVDERCEEVQVEIVDVEYVPQQQRFMMAGKTPVFRRYPAEYNVVVDYNGERFTFDDEELYEKYENSVGAFISGTLCVRVYDNGHVSEDIIKIE